MDNILNTALSNLKNRPAAYTIMIVVIGFGAYGVNQFQTEHLKFYSYVACLTAVLICLYLVLQKDIPNSVPNNKELSNHHLSDYLFRIENACRNVCEGKPSEHPLLTMIGGFMLQLSEEIAQESIEIAPKYYIRCFSNLRDLSNDHIYAIADLSEDVESWKDGRQSMWKNVKERIFHLNWEDMYSNRLDKLIENLNSDQVQIKTEMSDIKIVTSREAATLLKDHPLNPRKHIGNHLLIIGDSLIGGYIHTEDGDKLYLEASNKTEVDYAKDYYNNFRNKAIDFSFDMTAQDLRAAWIKKFDIGSWDSSWNGKEERNKRYVGEYDYHIQCWIPDYQLLLNKCHSVAKKEIEASCREFSDSINILEFGCGTGALSKKLVATVIEVNKALSSAVGCYQIIDQSSQMIDLAKNRINNGFSNDLDSFLKYEQLKITDSAKNTFGMKYQVIIGSLIFHFLIGKDWKPSDLEDLLNSLKENWLSKGGCIIFADVLFSPEKRDIELEYWRDHMLDQGMSSENIDCFFENNLDMLNSPNLKDISEASEAVGMKVDTYETSVYRNPFNVVKIFL